jgi:hypothetical protein
VSSPEGEFGSLTIKSKGHAAPDDPVFPGSTGDMLSDDAFRDALYEAINREQGAPDAVSPNVSRTAEKEAQLSAPQARTTGQPFRSSRTRRHS